MSDATVALGAVGRPGEDADQTVFMRKTPGQSRSEPELLTHREPEPDYGDHDDYDDYDDEPGAAEADGPLTDEQRAMRRKKIWRRVRRTMYVGTALMIIIPVLAFFITYQFVEVKKPAEVAAEQDKVVTLYYADGKTEMTKIAGSGANRIMLEYNQIPKHVLHAVYAAEDATFESNAGFDITGIMRAVWNNVTGGGGGGSTISQQYIKKSSGQEDKTLSRKWVELVKSYKMNETYEKDEIITAYLNTIYFGRGAYGIAAAAKAHYGVDISQVTKQQAAFLAGMIQTPSRWKDVEYQHQRWNYVSDKMVENKWMTKQERTEPFPAPLPPSDNSSTLPGPRKGIPDLVTDELKALNISEETMKQNGYKITTTIDPVAQDLAEKAVAEVMAGQPDNLHPGLVAVDPKTGNIVAYYPGSNGVGFDFAKARQEPGSAFKPFDLVGLLKMDKGLGEVYDSSPKSFGDRDEKVRNASTPSCGQCTVAQAMKESLNVVFSDMVYNDVKPRGVVEAAKEAGIRSPLDKAADDINIAIGGGATQVSTVDMASAYATFAADGIYRKPRLVSRIEYPDGGIVFNAATHQDFQERPAFDQDNPERNQKIARNVTESLLPVPKFSRIECANDRPCAGKTGTHQYLDTKDNSKAWMVGYTPQLSTAVSLSGDKTMIQLRDAKGVPIFGSGLPGKIWKKFMDSYHSAKKLPKEQFSKFVPIGKAEPVAPPPTQHSSSAAPPPSTEAPVTTTTTPEPSETAPTTTTSPTRTRPTRPSDSGGISIPGMGGDEDENDRWGSR
ncbi:transglycosylase domain-containing protein [Actinokineospora iranica]|uniref:Membrane carboxypeptidase (Penicillin-binding protein) n=1 Tax=Actinokineospora iranica TaxID=1271860 RepID=A0A1G6PQ03_9PSEU|nr:transglycosylase domain-containing protein [Actinokineospora iranica]SDC81457.1 Membrane carboxypeptidase (penicillin-binding protein) [Actinokineospora iranica]